MFLSADVADLRSRVSVQSAEIGAICGQYLVFQQAAKPHLLRL